MIITADLDGAPAGVPCAQLGQTPDFERFNLLETATYKAALIARHGLPPEGCSFGIVANRHDFGTYRTLKARADDASPEAVAWFNAVAIGLDTWLEASFQSPVEYDAAHRPLSSIATVAVAVRRALAVTRPLPDGRFPIPDFAVLHRNLRSAYPEVADEFDDALAS